MVRRVRAQRLADAVGDSLAVAITVLAWAAGLLFFPLLGMFILVPGLPWWLPMIGCCGFAGLVFMIELTKNRGRPSAFDHSPRVRGKGRRLGRSYRQG